ncbi:MAG: DUF1059 domain-containing protein [Candidatus Micrarchaeales archaeon]
MVRSFSCADIGISCNFRARANTDDELWKKISDHTKKVHNIQNMDREMMDKVQSVIKDI